MTSRKPRPNRRPSGGRLSLALWAAAVGVAALLISAVYEPSRSRGTGGPRSARVGPGTTVNLRVAIRTGLPSQHENTVLLEDNKPIALQVDYEAPRLEGYELRLRWSCSGGMLEHQKSEMRNRFTPPSRGTVCTINAELGLYPRRPYGGQAKAPVRREKAQLTVIVPMPGIRLRQDGMLDGFRIGRYLDPLDPVVRQKYPNSWALIHPEKFQPPRAFYLVDAASRNLPISPHLILGDYDLDFPWFTLGKRQYIALDCRLVQKYEDVIAELNRAGLRGDKVKIIYGFRPPSYNLTQMENDGTKALKAPFSFHQYGQAVDFILDADGNDQLDDLDGDGRITVRDAAKLVHHVNVLDRRYRDQEIPLFGGAGIYDHHDFWERPVQSPYVHMDVRGFLNENGTLIRWPAKWPDSGEPISWGKL